MCCLPARFTRAVSGISSWTIFLRKCNLGSEAIRFIVLSPKRVDWIRRLSSSQGLVSLSFIIWG